MSIIHELWYGNIVPQEQSRANTEKTKELLCYIANQHENLIKSFSNEQKELFEKYQNYWDEYISITEADIFEYAFKLSAQIAIAVLATKHNE